MSSIPILHFNDAYRVRPQKLSSKSPDTIDVTQFAQMVDDIRESWKNSSKEGLVFFSGDLLGPSVESSVTRGTHMVPVMNHIAPDAAVAGNHDFDFGYPHLTKLLPAMNFPWLLSNIIDSTTSKIPEPLKEYEIFERGGVRIGVIGLVEEEWIATISSWPPNFEYRSMADVARNLSARLRGVGKCDLIIALTHSRLPNDIVLARDLLAFSPTHIPGSKIASTHGVDVLLGGHDHFYFVSKGVTSWENYDVNTPCLGSEGDEGDVLVIKSGTDFRDLTSIELELEDVPETAEGTVRRKLVKSIKGQRFPTKPGSPQSQKLKETLGSVLESVNASLKAPVAKTDAEIDLRSQNIRTREMASSNWFADVLRHTYDDALCLKGSGGADAVFISAGTLRGDSVYGPGYITLGDIMEILPFEDSLVVLELDGETIWAAVEKGLEPWPAQEGRFPVTSGFRVVWDSRRPPGQRVISIHLDPDIGESTVDTPTLSPTTSRPGISIAQDPAEEVKREKGGRMYKVVTREYLASGHDGYEMLKGNKYLIEEEGGQMMSAVVRKYLLGSRFVNRMSRLARESILSQTFMQAGTANIIQRERKRSQRLENPKMHWKLAASLVIKSIRSKRHYQETLSVTQVEHMSDVDCFDGGKIIKEWGAPQAQAGKEEKGQDEKSSGKAADDLLVIHPVMDGRMNDIGRD